MAYFPESIMPPRLKDESQDFNSSPFVINARDVNKHDEEIRAIQKFIGVATPPTMVNGFSGMGADVVGGFSSFSSFSPVISFSSACYPLSIKQALDLIMDKIREVRDDMVLMDSGVVCVSDPQVSNGTGFVSFPSSWENTTMVSIINNDNSTSTVMPDDSELDDETSDLATIKGLTVANATGLPESGYLTIINKIEKRTYDEGSIRRDFTAFANFTDTNPTTGSSNIAFRRRHLGSNVEIIRYSGKVGNILYNIRRRQFGTSSSPHSAGDLVFKGRLTINVAPFMYVFGEELANDPRQKDIRCYLQSDGKIIFDVGVQDCLSGVPPTCITGFKSTRFASYASYHAILVKNIDTIPIYDPTSSTSCGV